MSRAAILASQARTDLRAELRWLGNGGQIAKARKLRDAIQGAAERRGERPLMGRTATDLLPEPYRFWSLTRFQLLLVYNSSTSPPRILRLLSTVRDLPKLVQGLES